MAYYTKSYDASGGRRPGTGAAKFVRGGTPGGVLASANSVGISGWTVSDRVATAAGEVWTVSAYARADVDFRFQIHVGCYDAAGAPVAGSPIAGAEINCKANAGWYRAFVTFTAPAGTTNFGIFNALVMTMSGNNVGGEQVWMCDALYDKAPILRPWHDGTSKPWARVNSFTSPEATTSWGFQPGTGASGTASIENDTRFKTGKTRQYVWTVAPSTNPPVLPYLSAAPMTTQSRMSVGETWVVALRYAPVGYSGAVSLLLGGTNSPSGTYGTQNIVDHGDGTFTAWRTFTVTNLNAGNGGFVPFMVFSDSAQMAGATIRIGDAFAERGTSTFEGFFYGGYSPWQGFTPGWNGSANAAESFLTEDDFTPVWNGTTGLSFSALHVPSVNTWSQGGGGRVQFQSNQWSSTGTKSMRVIPTTPSNDIPIRVAGADNSLTGLGMTFEPGETYTFLAKYRLARPLTGTLHAFRTLCLGVNYGLGSLTNVYGPSGPNVAGVHERRLVFTVPANADRCVAIVYGGASIGNGDVWWDDIMIVKGIYDGPYWDGSFTPQYPS